MKGKRMRSLCSESQRDKAWKSLGELDRSRFPDRRQTRQTAALWYAGGGPGEGSFLESASRHGRIEQTAHGGFSQHRRCSMCRCTTIFAWVRAWAFSQPPSLPASYLPYPSSAFPPFQGDHSCLQCTFASGSCGFAVATHILCVAISKADGTTENENRFSNQTPSLLTAYSITTMKVRKMRHRDDANACDDRGY